MNIIKYYFPVFRENRKMSKYCVRSSRCSSEHLLEPRLSQSQCQGNWGSVQSPYRGQCADNFTYTREALNYMSRRIDAELITGIIISHLKKIGLKYDNMTITDATAGIGGNTFSFAMLFKNVISVEKDTKTFAMLENNVKMCNLNNVKLIQSDYTDIMDSLIQNIVFIDPPWGGRNYKTRDNIMLRLSTIKLESICRKLLLRHIVVVLKLPLNYNFIAIYGKLYRKNIKIYIHELKKMFIVVIINGKK